MNAGHDAEQTQQTHQIQWQNTMQLVLYHSLSSLTNVDDRLSNRSVLLSTQHRQAEHRKMGGQRGLRKAVGRLI
ncbi:hypothetical protein E4U55_006311 [Claviceps digitariae]|nr:hypothetical protein E4U55_006311 [Claviceps digitariae]